jgi:hypothetical protein
MSNDRFGSLLKEQVEADLDAGGRPQPDLSGVTVRAQRRRWRRRLAVGAVCVGLLAGSWAIVSLLPTDDSRPGPDLAPADKLPPPEPIRVEPDPGTEQDQAAVFAVRAIANTGLLDPLGDYYHYREIEKKGKSWVVGFGASTCLPTTCKPKSGEEDELGFAPVDAWLHVTKDGETWSVVDASGNFSPGDTRILISFTYNQRQEVPHVEYPTVRVDEPIGSDDDGGLDIRAAGLWVGPIPSDVPGSVCTLRGFDAGGKTVYEGVPMWEDAAREESMRSGWLFGTGIPGDAGAETAAIDCVPFEGRGWYTETEPQVEAHGSRVDVKASLVWCDVGMTNADSSCTATVYDADGRALGEDRQPISGFWPPSRAEDPPFHETVFFHMNVPNAQAAATATVECRIS